MPNFREWEGTALPPGSNLTQSEIIIPFQLHPFHSILIIMLLHWCLKCSSCNNDFIRKEPMNEVEVFLFLKMFLFFLSEVVLIVVK